MVAKRRETREERRLREVMVYNSSQHLARVIDRLNAIDDINSDRYRRVHREMMKAAELVSRTLNDPISDATLRYFDGEEAVARRSEAARKAKLGKVVHIKDA